MDVKCDTCNGRGYMIIINVYPCSICNGKGYEDNWHGRERCIYCHGSGQRREEQHPICNSCGGAGKIKK